MKRKRILYLWAVLFVLCMTVFPAGATANAAIQNAVKSVTVRADKKKITKKTYALEIGERKSLKVTASPKGAVKSIRFKSNKPKIASVSKKGKVTAKNKGTAKIQITVTGKNGKKKSTWVKIRVTERKPASQPTPTPAPDLQPVPTPDPQPGTSNILIAYFSLADNANYPDDVDATTSASIVADNEERYGTTEYLARMIQKKVGGDLHRIETKEAYPDDFDAVVDQNHSEMQNGILPELKESNIEISKYDTVFIGYPIWATNVPQAILSFLHEYDLSGKKVIPFCTHDGYGAGSSYRTIGNACPQAILSDGLAVRSSEVSAAENAVTDWLKAIGITVVEPEPEPDQKPEPERKETPIKITIGDTALDGVIYNTALAEELKGHFPLTVSMSAYGGREYYGGLNFTPESLETGQLNFENGDITYCRTNNTMAIFYAQTEHPDLTMEVVPIGKVTSDLSVFESFGSREDITFSLAEEDVGGDTTEKNRILVAYFSATNTTERLAEFIADGLPADLYEIVPEIPYTSADLNYGDSSSRTSIEMNDPTARPAISGSVEDMGQYDTVFLGYPIWWGEAPRIVNTFLESYDFSGKTMIPFCTSGSSGIGSSATHLHSLTDGAEWLSGRRFGSSTTRNDIITWVNSLGLGFEAE